jgi:hypothetical protein
MQRRGGGRSSDAGGGGSHSGSDSLSWHKDIHEARLKESSPREDREVTSPLKLTTEENNLKAIAGKAKKLLFLSSRGASAEENNTSVADGKNQSADVQVMSTSSEAMQASVHQVERKALDEKVVVQQMKSMIGSAGQESTRSKIRGRKGDTQLRKKREVHTTAMEGVVLEKKRGFKLYDEEEEMANMKKQKIDVVMDESDISSTHLNAGLQDQPCASQ